MVEILSPRPRIGTLEERIDWFARYGVRECWVVHHPIGELDVLEFGGGVVVSRSRFPSQMPIRSSVLPQFTRSLGEILEPAE